MLVKRLHESLSRLEDFKVETVRMGRVDGESTEHATLMQDTRMISPSVTRSVRVRVQAEEEQDAPKPQMVLAIAILGVASLQTLHDYIRPRLVNGGRDAVGGGMAAIMDALTSGTAGPEATSRLLAALNARGLGSGADLNTLRSVLGSLAGEPLNPGAASTASAGDLAQPSSSTAAGEASSSTPKPKPQRRRSARLSAIDPPAEDAANALTAGPSTTAAEPPAGMPLSTAVAALRAGGLGMDVDFDDEEYSEEDYDQEVCYQNSFVDISTMKKTWVMKCPHHLKRRLWI